MSPLTLSAQSSASRAANSVGIIGSPGPPVEGYVTGPVPGSIISPKVPTQQSRHPSRGLPSPSLQGKEIGDMPRKREQVTTRKRQQQQRATATAAASLEAEGSYASSQGYWEDWEEWDWSQALLVEPLEGFQAFLQQSYQSASRAISTPCYYVYSSEGEGGGGGEVKGKGRVAKSTATVYADDFNSDCSAASEDPLDSTDSQDTCATMEGWEV